MRNLIAPAALAASLMLGSTALAATPQATGPATTAPVVQSEVVGRTMIGAPIKQDTVSRPVSYAGLNLANPADVKVADQRIDRAARQDCAQLRREDPALLNPTISGGHCVRSAEHDAKLSLKAAVTAARDLQ
jgi:UrcA family protein